MVHWHTVYAKKPCRIRVEDILQKPMTSAERNQNWRNKLKTRTYLMARHRKSPRSRRYLMVFDPLTPSQGHQFDPRVKIFGVSWSTAHPL